MSEPRLLSDAEDVGDRLRAAAEFEPGQLPRLRHLAEAWATAATARMTALAGTSFDFTLHDIEADFAPDLDADTASNSLYAVLSSSRFRHPGYVTLNNSGVEALIAALFAAEPSTSDDQPRKPTDLDRGVVKLALTTIAEAADPVFNDIAEFRLSASNLIDPSELAEQLGDPGDRFVLFRFELRVGTLTTTITFGLPSSFFAPHRRFLRELPDVVKLDRDENWSAGIKASFAQSDLRLDAVLAKKKIPLRRIAGFKVGETIELEINAASLIAVECEGRALLRARMGRSGVDYVLRIEERVDPAEEFIDDILSD
ncbi:FliM/FliN family flagellar motor switch protein [Aurantimonas sp. C2-6-R+9]|uniref:FliM/FliN family flagellar motor switch protein n=1 Tax=unclassified Aurantimonas TaxID=2638230 RepID=UPI002E1761D1|nr:MULTISPECIES: FliM/FliN family flagellar motor switch protein [unclassified Aurantimonas]MEC5291036.1 FliM/FliN family flagellar motor switch protein [Aurantimonas sp. C2-3-R2]MEC5323467.1 FliM/FliN family flagellar motor switch protein [Aurantimonas sp. A3-2-R12]MEC5381365.1 FliM/FliN family flagellar motor switch protein [Aurantimonas sp. C2-6-R+9]MEC5412187.1 FliM/FliN family flagellar motor switch protein [Aurantimonas sp. C2-4-R8]